MNLAKTKKPRKKTGKTTFTKVPAGAETFKVRVDSRTREPVKEDEAELLALWATETRKNIFDGIWEGKTNQQISVDLNVSVEMVAFFRMQLAESRPRINQDLPHADLIEAIQKELLNYVGENLLTLRVQSRFARIPEWLERQDAEGIAILHTTITNNTLQLLQTIQKFSLGEMEKDSQG